MFQKQGQLQPKVAALFKMKSKIPGKQKVLKQKEKQKIMVGQTNKAASYRPEVQSLLKILRTRQRLKNRENYKTFT